MAGKTSLIILTSLLIGTVFVNISFSPESLVTVVHDVAVVDVSASAMEVYRGEVINVSVIVSNEGTVAETFDVTAYADPIFLGTTPVTNLAPEDEKSLIFAWNTTDIMLKNYTVYANASIVYGETDVADNVFVDGAVRVVDAVAVYVNPSSIVLPAPSYGTRFDLAINIWNVTDLYAFGFSLTWNSSLTRLISHEINPIWPEGQYYVVVEAVDTEAGTYHVVITALGETAGYNVTQDESIITFTFEVALDPGYPQFFSSSILLENVELSDSYGAKIDCYVRSGLYVIRSRRPRLLFSPSIVRCRNDGSNFTVRIGILMAIGVSGFSLHVKYDPTFLDVTEAVFADFLKGPYMKVEMRRDDEAGYVHLSMEQEHPANGSGTLAILNFRVNSNLVYRWWAGDISTLSSSVRLVESELNVTYPEPGVLKQKSGQIIASGATFGFILMPGDLNLDGSVDINDLVAMADHYGCGAGCRFDLNGDSIVDIYDIVLVAQNFGKKDTG